MALFSRLFSKNAEDFIAKGDRLFAEQRFFEARNVFEDGLQRLLNGKNGSTDQDVVAAFRQKIARANTALAELNLEAAQHALSLGTDDKATEHLELAISLTDDALLREKAEVMLKSIAAKPNETNEITPALKSCHSCSSPASEIQAGTGCEDSNLSPMDYYDLLIRQLPGEMYNRYAELGEEFAYMYLASSNDDHKEALKLLENWFDGTSRDIYSYEKGMILYRSGQAKPAEACLLDAIRENAANPLPHLGLVLLLIDSSRLEEAAIHLDDMIANSVLPEQSLLLRAEVAEQSGDLDGAIERYAVLLQTPLARAAAEKLYPILMHCGRQDDADTVFKRYLKGCCH